MKPLRGTRIVDLSRYAPGPYCTLVCAALGADVVKVEAPGGGDPLRQLDPAAFARLNRGKKSVELDLKESAGRSRLLSLLTGADVLLESFRPGVMVRLGLDYESVARVAPRLLYLSISGYGQSGPYAGRAGHDVNYAASAGVLDGVGKPLPLQIADFASGGLFAVIAILSAVMEGEGRYVDLSMQEGLFSLSMLSDGAVRDALSGRYPNYTIYETSDGGALSVGALEPKFWKTFCRVIDRPDLEGRIAEPEARAVVAACIAGRTGDEWEEAFRGEDACAEIVLRPEDARTHAQLRYRTHSPSAFQLPFGLTEREAETLGPSPELGEHTEEILNSLS